MALAIKGKKVLGYALGENEFLSGNGAENLNMFYIDEESHDSDDRDWNHQSFTIDMTDYFSEADADYSDVQYYQIMVETFYNSDDTEYSDHLYSPLLKRGEINNKQSGNEGDGTMSVWFTDNTTLAVRLENNCDHYEGYTYTNQELSVYGFTSHDVGSVL